MLLWAPTGSCRPPQGGSDGKELLLSKVGNLEVLVPHNPLLTGTFLFRANLVLVKEPGVALFCFDRKYIKPRFTENVESGFTTSLGPWLPEA